MYVEIVLTDQSNAYIFKNFYPLYLHDISQFDGERPNEHGILSDPVRDLVAQGNVFNNFWEEPDVLFPYLIVVDGTPAGFNLVARGAYVPIKGIDFFIKEFFLTHAFRGKGVGEKAAILGFEQFRGCWEVVTYPNNPRAIRFWRKVMKMYAPNNFTEREGDHPWGHKVIWQFDNKNG